MNVVLLALSKYILLLTINFYDFRLISTQLSSTYVCKNKFSIICHELKNQGIEIIRVLKN